MTLCILAPDDPELFTEKNGVRDYTPILKRKVFLDGLDKHCLKDGTYLRRGVGDLVIVDERQDVLQLLHCTGIVDCENGAVEFMARQAQNIDDVLVIEDVSDLTVYPVHL